MGLLLKKYTWVINLFLIFLGTYFVAKMAATLIAGKIRVPKNFQATQMVAYTPEAKSFTSMEDYRVIIERNIFDSRQLEPEQVGEATPEATEVNLEGPAVKTSLPIKLIATISVGDGTDKRSSATISGSGRGGEDTYTVEDEKQFSPGARITKILKERVEFVNNNRLEFVEMEDFGGGLSTTKPISSLDRGNSILSGISGKRDSEPAKGIEEVGQGKFMVDRTELDSALENLDQLFTQIRAVPQFKDGKATGLKLLSVRSGSLFAKLGLRRNDVLERINGQTIDMKRGMEIFGQLKDSEQISIDLVRDGQKTTLEYNIQ